MVLAIGPVCGQMEAQQQQQQQQQQQHSG
jgi:hypothetical protein